MIKVLVSGPGGDVGQGVISCLQDSSIDMKIYKIGASLEDAGLYGDSLSYISPRADDLSYIDYICHFIQTHGIDIFIPCIDSEILSISQHKSLIESATGAHIFVGSPQQIEICTDKFQTSRFLKEKGFCGPETYIFDQIPRDLTYPIILKPRIGSGSKDIHLIRNKQQLFSFERDNTYILQEYLDGDDYTAGIYLGDDNEVKGTCIFKRKLKNGSTWYAERVVDKEMEEYVNSVATQVGLKYLNIQFRLKEGAPCPFEFNGRFSGTTGMMKRIFNAPEMLVKEKILKKHIITQTNSTKFYVMRSHSERYVSLEDFDALHKRSREQ